MSETIFKAQQAKRDEQDALIEDKRQLIIDRTKELLETDIEGRNLLLWEFFEVSAPGLPISRYEEVEIADRDLHWAIEHGSMLAAANYQALFESHVADMLDNADKFQSKVDKLRVVPKEIRALIKRKEKQEDARASTV